MSSSPRPRLSDHVLGRGLLWTLSLKPTLKPVVALAQVSKNTSWSSTMRSSLGGRHLKAFHFKPAHHHLTPRTSYMQAHSVQKSRDQNAPPYMTPPTVALCSRVEQTSRVSQHLCHESCIRIGLWAQAATEEMPTPGPLVCLGMLVLASFSAP